MVGPTAVRADHRRQSSTGGECTIYFTNTLDTTLDTTSCSQHLHGVIVILSADGRLEACYLGSEPSLFVAPPLHPRGYDYAAAERELSELRAAVSSKSKQTGEIGRSSIAPIIDDKLDSRLLSIVHH